MQKIIFFLLSLTTLLPIIAMDSKEIEFFDAIKAHNLGEVTKLIAEGVNIDAENKDKETPIIVAIRASTLEQEIEPDVDIIKAIANEMPNMNIKSKSALEPLGMAANVVNKEKREKISDIIEKAERWYALYQQMTAVPSNTSAIKSTFSRVGTVNNSSDPNKNLLALAITRKLGIDIINELIDKGANVNQLFSDGTTPLSLAKNVRAADDVLSYLSVKAPGKQDLFLLRKGMMTSNYFLLYTTLRNH